MELGTAVFLSAVFLGSVALFIATKDRWNWKKLLLWPLTVVLGLSAIGGAGFYINSRIQERPQKELGLWDIQLGAGPADVKFIKGNPQTETEYYATWIVENEHLKGTRKFDITAELYKRAKADEAGGAKDWAAALADTDATWRYRSDDGRYVIKFQDGKVRFVTYDGSSVYAASIQGISRYTSLDELVGKFGRPSYVSRSKDELRRWVSFDKFNVAFMLEKKRNRRAWSL